MRLFQTPTLGHNRSAFLCSYALCTQQCIRPYVHTSRILLVVILRSLERQRKSDLGREAEVLLSDVLGMRGDHISIQSSVIGGACRPPCSSISTRARCTRRGALLSFLMSGDLDFLAANVLTDQKRNGKPFLSEPASGPQEPPIQPKKNTVLVSHGRPPWCACSHTRSFGL